MAKVRNPTLTKDPQAVLNYTFDWSDWLPGGVTIASASITSTPVGLTLGTPSNDSTSITIEIRGGTAGTEHELTWTVTFSTGEIDDATTYLRIGED